jgi:hypothetical protein
MRVKAAGKVRAVAQTACLCKLFCAVAPAFPSETKQHALRKKFYYGAKE